MKTSEQRESRAITASCQAYIDWLVWPVVSLVSSYTYNTLRNYYDKGQSVGPIDWYHVAFVGTCLILISCALEIIKRKPMSNEPGKRRGDIYGAKPGREE